MMTAIRVIVANDFPLMHHLTKIRDKTGLRRRSELARWAVEHAVA